MGRGSGASAVKLYYRIGEVAGIVGVEPHVLRYWESEFPTIRPQKSRSGQRVYSRRDVDKLLRVKELLYTQRFTIAGARQRIRDAAAENTPATEVESSPVVASASVAQSASVVPSALVETNSDGLRSSAQTLRATLLAARHDVCRLLESFESAHVNVEASAAGEVETIGSANEGERVPSGSSRASHDHVRTQQDF